MKCYDFECYYTVSNIPIKMYTNLCTQDKIHDKANGCKLHKQDCWPTEILNDYIYLYMCISFSMFSKSQTPDCIFKGSDKHKLTIVSKVDCVFHILDRIFTSSDNQTRFPSLNF